MISNIQMALYMLCMQLHEQNTGSLIQQLALKLLARPSWCNSRDTMYKQGEAVAGSDQVMIQLIFQLLASLDLHVSLN